MEAADGEAKFDDSVVDIAGSTEHTATDPVVYKLVRVDGDGRLVPATDDEIMVVEDFLEDDNREQIVSDLEQPVKCGIYESCALQKAPFSNLEGTLASQNMEDTPQNMNVLHGLVVNVDKPKQEGIVSPLPPSSGHSSISQRGGLEGCLIPPCGLIKKRSQISVIGSTWKPEFSKLQGELCLDNLTVKELQQTFRATFGRETSVKDKQWLKRRIVMGLTNASDFSATSVLIKDGIVMKKGKEQTSENKDVKASRDPVAGITSESCGGPPISHDNQMEDNFVGGKARDSSVEYNSVSEAFNIEQRAAKRVRKPTKRYIEEISEVETRESSGKSISPNKSCGHGQIQKETRVRSVPNVSSNRPQITREDSLGGSGVQVPYVSRIRRGRPRENITALAEFQPHGIVMEGAGLMKGLGVRSPKLNDKKGNEVHRSQLSWIHRPVIATGVTDNQHLDRKFVELDNCTAVQDMNSLADSSDDNAVTMSVPQGGMRRKHHRPWSISEVLKLVEGVAKYGAGRWSEIKRVSFASSPYRTSVDLKDKWRNLLRASFAQLPEEKGMQNVRKHSSIPVPAAILLRVRELAEKQAQVPPMMSASKFAVRNSGSLGRSVHVAKPGYL